MLKLISKFFVTSGTLSGIFFINLNNPNISFSRKENESNEENKSQIASIKSIEDIKLFEKVNNCTFAFVGAWKDKRVYQVEEFLNSHKDTHWKNKVISGAEKFKESCKSNKQIALFYGSSHQSFHTDRQKFQND